MWLARHSSGFWWLSCLLTSRSVASPQARCCLCSLQWSTVCVQHEGSGAFLVLFPVRSRSCQFFPHCRSRAAGRLGAVMVRLCVAVPRGLCWLWQLFSCLGDICTLGCHDCSFFCCGTTGNSFTTELPIKAA